MFCFIKNYVSIQESEAFLTAEAEQSSHKTVRDKRTIGFLRQLFPNLSQVKPNIDLLLILSCILGTRTLLRLCYLTITCGITILLKQNDIVNTERFT